MDSRLAQTCTNCQLAQGFAQLSILAQTYTKFVRCWCSQFAQNHTGELTTLPLAVFTSGALFIKTPLGFSLHNAGGDNTNRRQRLKCGRPTAAKNKFLFVSHVTATLILSLAPCNK